MPCSGTRPLRNTCYQALVFQRQRQGPGCTFQDGLCGLSRQCRGTLRGEAGAGVFQRCEHMAEECNPPSPPCGFPVYLSLKPHW